MRRDDPRVVTIADFYDAAQLYGLEVATLSETTSRIIAVLKPCPPGIVIHPVPERRLDALRIHLTHHGIVGVHWDLALEGRTLPRMTTSKATKIANIVTVVFVILLALAAIAGVIYGVTTHTEPGLDPRAITWPRDRFPLRVCSSSYAGDFDAAPIVATALDVTNDRLGFEVLASSREDACDVLVILGVPAEEGWMDPGGDAHFGHGPTCTIRTSNTGTTEIRGLVIQHEIGHCLGLDHDDFEGSIMRRVQTSTPDRTFAPRITDTDRDTLRELYAPAG